MSYSILKSAQYKHIIWDFNGTILNDAWLFVDIMNGILKMRNMRTITIKKYREIFGFPIENYYKKLGFDLDNQSFEESGLEFIKTYKKRRYEAKLYPLVHLLLSELLSINIHHSILSAGHQSLLDDLTAYYNIRKYFTFIDGLNNFHAKGKVDKGFEFINKTGLQTNEVILIGDTDHDLEVAQAIGTDCLLISHGHHSYSKLIKTKAPVVRGLEDIFRIFSIELNHKKPTLLV